MPIYDFECRKCKHTFEAILKVADNHQDLACPACGAKRAKKLVATFRTNMWSSFLDNMERKVSPHKFK